jgi:hypothetical protein
MQLLSIFGTIFTINDLDNFEGMKIDGTMSKNGVSADDGSTELLLR